MIYARYQDDGPRGPCGQSMNITSNWDILYRCVDRNAFDRLREQVECCKGRRRPRITAAWSDDYTDGLPRTEDFN